MSKNTKKRINSKEYFEKLDDFKFKKKKTTDDELVSLIKFSYSEETIKPPKECILLIP